ncbi:MAG: class I SAM-dependent rRNA methyltransferase [Anaerolineae bacterium]|nr:class I SAM-dependent rRNA methyltransferase [Anaerolineae bacterium]
MTSEGAAPAGCDVVLKPGRDKRARNRHPWVFSGAIARVIGDPEAGEAVRVLDHRGRFVAFGYYNRHSQIRIRLMSWDPSRPADDSLWRQLLEESIDRRRSLLAGGKVTACRLVYAESDGMPGLILDRYGDWLVLQALAAGVERRKLRLAEAALELTGARGVYERSDVDVRRHEGLGERAGTLLGEEPPHRVKVLEHGIRWLVDVREGQKTGFYLDQRENRRRLRAYAAGARVLNVFAYTGGFGVAAAVAGAEEVVHVDSSADALAQAREHVALNGLDAPDSDAHRYVVGDAFQVLREMRDRGEQYDLVVLDPPKFAFSQRDIPAATRGYKDINMLGMALLRPGGTLATFSCSGRVSENLFQKVLFGASVDVGRDVRVLERLHQAPDHPVLLTFPEGAYLKGVVARVD